jgi:hypothetical protein
MQSWIYTTKRRFFACARIHVGGLDASEACPALPFKSWLAATRIRLACAKAEPTFLGREDDSWGQRRAYIWLLSFYVRHVHVYGTCCAALCSPRLRAFECVGFRRVCISLGWSCGVLLMRVSEVKSVPGNTFRLSLHFFFSCAVLGRCCRSIERLVAGEDEIWNLRFGITCILRLSARVSLPVRRYCQCHRPRLVDSYAAVV